MQATGFSLVNARACAAAAKAAYLNAACGMRNAEWGNGETPLPGPLPAPSSQGEGEDGGAEFVECKATNTQALVIDCGTAVVVAFRGTQEPLDFVTDAAAWRRNIAGCTVHFGFWKAMVSVFAGVSEAVRKCSGSGGSFEEGDKAAPLPGPLPAPSSRGEGEDGSFPVLAKPLFVTGHSLGGALAVLFAYRYVAVPAAGGMGEMGRMGRMGGMRTDGMGAALQVYTFGQPRVGDGNFARRYDRFHGGQTWRVVNDQDIVPRVPGWLLGYRHCGNEALLSAEFGMRSAELGIANREPDLQFEIRNLKSGIPHSELRTPHSRIILNPGTGFKLVRDAWALWRARRTGSPALAGLFRDHQMDNYLGRLGN